MLGKFKDFVFSDILGVKIVAKKEDTLGNLEVFVLSVGCWGWVVWGGKMHMTRIDLSRIFRGLNLTLKSDSLEVNSRFLC